MVRKPASAIILAWGSSSLQVGVLRVDLRLGLIECGAWFEPGNHLDDISPGMPVRRGASFRTRSQREIQLSLGGEKAKARGQHADHGFRKFVHANLPAHHVRVGIEMLAPIIVGEDRDGVGLISCFLLP